MRYVPVAAVRQTYASLTRWDGRPLPPDFQNRKVAAGICGILLGWLGIHKFILGYAGQGVIMLVVSIAAVPLSFILLALSAASGSAGGLAAGAGISFIAFLAPTAMGIIGFIEGIIYLTKSDRDFVIAYGVNKRGWF